MMKAKGFGITNMFYLKIASFGLDILILGFSEDV